jgi:ABC-type transport system substrate-binding protein
LRIVQSSSAKKPDFFFDLDFECLYVDRVGELGNLIKQDLKEIGINASFESRYYIWSPPPKIPGDFSGLVDTISGNHLVTPYYYYDEEGYWSNIYLSPKSFPSDVPYMIDSMQKLNECRTQMNFTNQILKFREWQDLASDKVLLVFPLFDTTQFIFSWNNIIGFNHCWGISDSLPYMYFDGMHENQRSTEELNLYDYLANSGYSLWNPYIDEDEMNTFILEPLLKMTPDRVPTRRGLIKDWEYLDDNHIKFYLRENLYWSPSYNLTYPEGKSNNLPLMLGLKNNETSDGLNQRITAFDAVFTLLLHANTRNDDYNDFLPFVKKLYVDPHNNLTFHVKFDYADISVDNRFFRSIWEDLNTFCLPEFFLNSTNTELTFSTGGVKTWGLYENITITPQWSAYLNFPFGCGKYYINYRIPYEKIVLLKNPNWHGVGAIDGNQIDIAINKIRFLRTPKIEAFENGDFDIISSSRSKFLKYINNSNFECYSKPQESQFAIVFNLYRENLGKDSNFEYLTEPGKEEYTKALAVRKAIAYAINRERINDELYNGTYFISKGQVSQKYSSWFSDNSAYEYNLTKAWEWMEAAGYHKDSLKASMFKTIFSPLVILVLIILMKKRRILKKLSSNSRIKNE